LDKIINAHKTFQTYTKHLLHSSIHLHIWVITKTGEFLVVFKHRHFNSYKVRYGY